MVHPTARFLTATSLTLLAACAAFAGCSGGSDNKTTSSNAGDPTSTAGSGGAGGGGTTDGGGGAGGAIDPPDPVMRKKVSGDVTWTVTFDDAAKAAGATDCLYTRHYEGVEDRGSPWLCPTCEIMFRADVEVTAGLADCYSQVSTNDPANVEWIGYEPGGIFRRGVGGPMSDQGTSTMTAGGFDTVNAVKDVKVPAGGTLAFDVAGSLAVGVEEGDPMNGWTPATTYACGWPKSDAPEYTGDYVLKKGKPVPDGVFKDKCDEVVRLHDFKGAYLLVDMSARDCPPCQQMAGQEEAFIADMKAQGIDVRVVTLLAPSLTDTIGKTTTAMLKTWTTKYKLTSPVLADRAWGLSLFGPAIGADNLGYPSWVLVDPDLNALDFGSGFNSYDDFKTAILDDAKP